MAIFGRHSKVVLIPLSFLFFSCSGSSDSDESIVEVQSGEKIYLQNCISCHGKTGNLEVSGASDLTKSKKTLAEKIEFIKKGGPNGIMQAYGKNYGGPFNDDQIEKLAEYVDQMAH